MPNPLHELGMSGRKLFRATALICAEMFFTGAPYAILYLVLLDIFTNPVPLRHLCFLLAALLVSFFLQSFFAVKGHIEASLFAFRSGGALRLKLGEQLRRLPLGYFQQQKTGELVETFLFDVSVLESSISHLYTKLVASIVLPCIVAAILFGIDWRLSLSVVTTVPLAFCFMRCFKKGLAQRSEKHMQARRAFADSLLEFLHGVETYKAYNIAGRQAVRLDAALRSFCRESIAFENITAPMVFIYSFILDCGLPLLLALSFYCIGSGSLAETTVILFMWLSP